MYVQKGFAHWKETEMKKITAIVASFAAMLLSVFALAPTAMAADYSATITPGTAEGAATVTVSIDEATAQEYPFIAVQYDDAEVASVVPAAVKQTQWYPVASAFGKEASGDYSKLFKVTTRNCEDTTITVRGSKIGSDEDAVTLQAKTVSFANTCTTGSNENVAVSGTAGSSRRTTAQTGSVVMPYVIALGLMVAAGVALFAVRKGNAR